MGKRWGRGAVGRGPEAVEAYRQIYLDGKLDRFLMARLTGSDLEALEEDAVSTGDGAA